VLQGSLLAPDDVFDMRRPAGLTPICAFLIDVLDLLAQAQMA
jgi:hypothetical protein